MRMEMTQDQRQIISPALIQTLELVMLPTLELKEKLEEESKANPVIQLERKKPSESTRKNSRMKSTTGFDNQAFLENLSVYDFSLFKYMMEQVREIGATEREQKIAEIILSSIHENGFLQNQDDKGMMRPIPVEKLLDETDFSQAEFEKVRQKILRLDPVGVAAFTLPEYLAVQAEEKFGARSLEFRILRDCLDLLEKKMFTKIAREFHVTQEEVVKAIENISGMNITPTSAFSHGTSQYVVPDAYVNVTEKGIELTLNDEYIPEVRLNKHCIELFQSETYLGKKTKLAKDEKQFLRENIDRARILIENLKSRKEIIFKVILKIVEKQKDYFLKGTEYQIPLKLKDIADELSVHESTVSRVVREKYIQTNKGIINLKSFFSANVGEQSSKSLKGALKTFIDAEDRDDPLSDDRIVQIFKKKGVDISRRTVAKYRSELNIPPAFMRRNPI